MRTLLQILKKEFIQIFRNQVMLRIILVIPIMQLVILVYAANFEMKNISLGVVDKDNSPMSQQLLAKFQASNYFKLNDFNYSTDDAMENLARDKTDILVEIPFNFERDIYKSDNPTVSITVNAINGMKAVLATSYAGNIIGDFGKEKAVEILPVMSQNEFNVTYSNWFNPRLDYKTLMLPGVLGLIITVVGVMLSALNIVREKEIGTIEQINVTPIKRWQFIVGKLVPFGVIGLTQLTLGLIVSVVFFDLQIVGSLWLFYGVVTIYMIALLGFGFFISIISDTQMQAMYMVMFFVFIFILLSGLFTPTDSMPQWARWLNVINPTAYLMEVIRLIVLKGSQLGDIVRQVSALAIFAVGANVLVIWKYKKLN